MRTTLTLNDTVYRALKLQAFQTDSSISKVVESAVIHQLLEDMEDIEDAVRRDKEPVYSFDTLVSEFKAKGLL